LKKDLLDLPVRKMIYEYVRLNPGVYFREMERDLDLAVGQLDFHLAEMVKGEILVRQEQGGNVRYFIRDRFSQDEKKILAAMRKEIPRTIILYLLDNPGATPSRILEEFTFSAPNLSYHLRKLHALGIVTFDQKGREKAYSVDDAEAIHSLLIMYKRTLFDKVLDMVA